MKHSYLLILQGSQAVIESKETMDEKLMLADCPYCEHGNSLVVYRESNQSQFYCFKCHKMGAAVLQ
jgi:transposase-like protein